MLNTLTVAECVDRFVGEICMVLVYTAYGRAYSVVTVLSTVEVRTYDLPSESFLDTLLLWYNVIMHYAKVPSGICTKG